MEREKIHCQLDDGFISTEDYKKARLLLSEKSVLFLHGLSGSGKTTIAETLGAEYKGYWLIKCSDMRSMKNSLIEKCNTASLPVTFPADCYPLDRFLDSGFTSGRLIILDDVEDIDRVVRSIRRKPHQAKFIVTTQRNLIGQNFSILTDSENELKIDGFTPEEAETYLKISKQSVDDLLKCIGALPIALSAFKGALQSNESDSQDHFIKRYIDDMDETKENLALECISQGLKRALVNNPFYEKLVKHLSMFSCNDITVDLLVALIEELGESEGFAFANHFVNRLDNRSLCVLRRSDTGMLLINIHNLVKRAMENLVKQEEYADIIRCSLQAFSRIMPLDGRNHQPFILPKMLDHGLNLLKKLKGSKSHPSALTQLLHGQLLTSIGYCMLSHRHDAEGVIKILEDGLEVFLKLLSDHGSRNLDEVVIDKVFEQGLDNKLLSDDGNYKPFIKTLRQLHRVTPRDFEVLFYPEKYDEFHPNIKYGHLTECAIEELLKNDLLLKEDLLVKIYPLELLAFHLNMLSRAYDYQSPNDGNLDRKAVLAAKKADRIYVLLEENGVPLLGMYVNKRNLLDLQKDGDIDSLLRDWDALLIAEGNAYECGITRTKDLKNDKYHKLLCLQGRLYVCGRRLKITDQEEPVLKECDKLINDIVELSKVHKRKHITLSKSYQKIAKFYESYENYHDAIRYLLNSMMEYNEYCLESLEDKSGKSHPELDDDNIKKFDAIYYQLKRCVTRSKSPYLETRDLTVKYIQGLAESWQKRSQVGQGETFIDLMRLIEGSKCGQPSYKENSEKD